MEGRVPVADAAKPPTTAARRPVAGYLLFAAAASLLLAAVIHAAGYFSIAAAVDSSSLTAHYRGIVRALWIGASIQPVVIAGILLVAGLRPASVAKPALVLVALLPLLASSVRDAHTGSLTGSILPALALVLTIAGVAASHPARNAGIHTKST